MKESTALFFLVIFFCVDWPEINNENIDLRLRTGCLRMFTDYGLNCLMTQSAYYPTKCVLSKVLTQIMNLSVSLGENQSYLKNGKAFKCDEETSPFDVFTDFTPITEGCILRKLCLNVSTMFVLDVLWF